MLCVHHSGDEFHHGAANPLSIGGFLQEHDVAVFRRSDACHILIGRQDDGGDSYFSIAPQILNDGEPGFTIAQPIVRDDEIRLAQVRSEFVANCGAAAAGDHVAVPGLENCFGRESTLLIIIDDNDKGTGEYWILPMRGCRRHLPKLIEGSDGQLYAKHGAFSDRRSCEQLIV